MFLSAEWYETDIPALAECARRDGMLTVIANHADSVGSYTSVGRSAIWAAGGRVLVQAAGTEEVLLTAGEGSEGWVAEVLPL
jgi:predicted amidohydrolase